MSKDRCVFEPSYDLDEERELEWDHAGPAVAPGKVTRTLRLAPRTSDGTRRASAGGASRGPAAATAAAVATGAHAALPAVQRRAVADDMFADVLPAPAAVPPLEVAAAGLRGSASTLPHLEVIQAAFGHHDVSAIGAHTGGEATAATRALGAMAYASGERVAFASSMPDLFTAAHEAAHVVQQRAGVALPEGLGRANDRYDAERQLHLPGDDNYIAPSLATAAKLADRLVMPRPSGGWCSSIRHGRRVARGSRGRAACPRLGGPSRRCGHRVGCAQ